MALLYSDGLTEPINAQGEAFGIQRTRQVLLAHKQKRAREICNKLWKAVQAHSSQMPNQDDFTTVVIKRL
jgi:serine phosphatase RsbU (regulator of sigma subunit)